MSEESSNLSYAAVMGGFRSGMLTGAHGAITGFEKGESWHSGGGISPQRSL